MSVGLEMDWDLPTGEGMVNFMRSRMMKIIGMMRRIWKMKSARDFENYHPQFQHYWEDFRLNHDRRGLGYQPLDELTKRMKVDMSDFYGKLEPDAFEDWLTAIEDYFD